MLNENLVSESRPLADRALAALERRARLLLPADRALVELAIRKELPAYQIAHLLGNHPSAVTRRVRRIIRRLQTPMVVNLIDNGRRQLPDELWRIGIERFVQNRTLGQIAESHRISLYAVRTMVDQVRGWSKAHQRSGG